MATNANVEKNVILSEKPPANLLESRPRTRGWLASEEYTVKAMPAVLNTFDMTAIYLTIIFFITNVTTAISGGAATFTYFLIGAVTFFIPCAIATAQLGVMFPYEGSLYNWTHKAFGGYWSFFVAFCAWFPGVLLIVSAGDVIVSCIQGLNSNWLIAPWQQGIVLIALLVLSGMIAIQPLRMVQNMTNVMVCLTFLAVLLVGTSGVVWLLKGHHAAISFGKVSDWSINPGNIVLFGFVAQAYLGIEVPLNMAGEITGRKVITRHLLWGTILVCLGYFVTSFGILVVQGTVAAGNPFSVISTVDIALGKPLGDVVAICVIAFFIMATVVYNSAYARLLFVGGVDKRLPFSVAKLNRHRVPTNAIIFQTIVAIVFAALAFLAVPYLFPLGKPADLSAQVYNVVLAASTLVWSISTAFLLINLASLYFRNRPLFRTKLIFPQPLIWVCIVVGTISCLFAIIDTVYYSWIPQQIHNEQWRLIIAGVTIICIVLAVVGSFIASTEADWEKFRE